MCGSIHRQKRRFSEGSGKQKICLLMICLLYTSTITATGRISSTEPNLQNIPVRMELGRLIRKVFIPVSYTHLDVYKRQFLHTSRGAWRSSSQAAFAASVISAAVIPFSPLNSSIRRLVMTSRLSKLKNGLRKSKRSDSVSYTHLDVYKRQVSDRTWTGS